MFKKRYAGVLVKCNDKVLLCKRNNHGSFPGMWSIPCGRMEEGEEPMEASKREFFEETDIPIDDAPLKYIDSIPRYTRDGKKMKGIMYVFGLEVENEINPDLDNAKDGEEHTEASYFRLDEIDSEMCGNELFKIIEKYFEKN
jgi:ADP-ribose pyrophosphatase YjhB (NUDIX family)